MNAEVPAAAVSGEERARRTLGGTAHRSIVRRLAGWGAVIDWNWTTRLTLLYLLLKSFSDWWVRFPITTVAILGLLVPGWHRKPWIWWILCVPVAAVPIHGWSHADNHFWLLFYWCLSVAIATSSRHPALSLRLSARTLVGLVFVFASLWKLVLAPEYGNGDFMRVTMLTDSRFAEFTRIFTDVDPDAAQRTLVAVVEARSRAAEPGIVPLPETERSIWVAWLSSWFVGLVEFWVGLAFLLGLVRDGPGGERSRLRTLAMAIGSTRNVVLLLFAAITYPFATVVGFGWLLMILGLGQCEPRQGSTKLAYLLAVWLILAAQGVPLVEKLAQLF